MGPFGGATFGTEYSTLTGNSFQGARSRGCGVKYSGTSPGIRDFLRKNDNAVVLYLGCGLDTRITRIDPPAFVDWYDLDYLDVIGGPGGKGIVTPADRAFPSWADHGIHPKVPPHAVYVEVPVPEGPGMSF